MLTSTPNKIRIELDFGQLRPVLEWCERNCTGDWRYTEDPNGGMYSSWIFLFDTDRDYVAFLMWKK